MRAERGSQSVSLFELKWGSAHQATQTCSSVHVCEWLQMCMSIDFGLKIVVIGEFPNTEVLNIEGRLYLWFFLEGFSSP